MVSRLRNGIAEMFALPDGYEVMLGNGGSTVFWDIATFGLIEKRSQHLTFGEFSSKFAAAAKAAPFLDEPSVISAEPGTRPQAVADPSVDTYAFTHNETSTGVASDLQRVSDQGIVLVDATSAAGGLRFDANQTDVYYFAPQKCLASDGGLWIATVSPAAIERIEKIAASGRWIPESLNLATALDNSRKDQTYNTPALATIFLAVQQIEWVNENGGLHWAAGRSDQSANIMYNWAEARSFASPFVTNPEHRSHVVATIDMDEAIDVAVLNKVLRANGIVDTEGYRKLGRNQIRVAMFPSIDPSDIEALTNCIDYIVERL
jgi:phosphoserine aminotransferase